MRLRRWRRVRGQKSIGNRKGLGRVELKKTPNVVMRKDRNKIHQEKSPIFRENPAEKIKYGNNMQGGRARA